MWPGVFFVHTENLGSRHIGERDILGSVRTHNLEPGDVRE